MYPYAEVYRLDNSVLKNVHSWYREMKFSHKPGNNLFSGLNIQACNINPFKNPRILRDEVVIQKIRILGNIQFIGGE
jgi:hypothetical protein